MPGQVLRTALDPRAVRQPGIRAHDPVRVPVAQVARPPVAADPARAPRLRQQLLNAPRVGDGMDVRIDDRVVPAHSGPFNSRCPSAQYRQTALYSRNRRRTLAVIRETPSSTQSELGQQMEPAEKTAAPRPGSCSTISAPLPSGFSPRASRWVLAG